MGDSGLCFGSSLSIMFLSLLGPLGFSLMGDDVNGFSRTGASHPPARARATPPHHRVISASPSSFSPLTATAIGAVASSGVGLEKPDGGETTVALITPGATTGVAVRGARGDDGARRERVRGRLQRRVRASASAPSTCTGSQYGAAYSGPDDRTL